MLFVQHTPTTQVAAEDRRRSDKDSDVAVISKIRLKVDLFYYKYLGFVNPLF